MSNTTLKISFNILSPSITKQLRTQGFKFDNDIAKEFDENKESLGDLSLSDLLTDKQETSVRQKIFKRIEAHVKKQNKLKSILILKTQDHA